VVQMYITKVKLRHTGCLMWRSRPLSQNKGVYEKIIKL